MKFSEKIKQLRTEKGLTQEQVCKELDIAISSLRNYENGRLPDTYQLKKIKNFYDVSYEYLLEDDCNNLTNTNLNIGKKLKLSDKSIEKIEETIEWDLSSEFNYCIENMNYYSLTSLKILKKLYTIKTEYIDFFITLYALSEYITSNINNVMLINNLLSIYESKLHSIMNSSILSSLEDIIEFPIKNDIVIIDEALSKIINLIKNKKAKTSDYITYVDNILEISNKFNTYLSFYKYNFTNSLDIILDKISPLIQDVYNIYYKDLDKYYDDIIDLNCDYGFGKDVIKKARTFLKKTNSNYVNVSTLSGGVKNGSTRNNKK